MDREYFGIASTSPRKQEKNVGVYPIVVIIIAILFIVIVTSIVDFVIYRKHQRGKRGLSRGSVKKKRHHKKCNLQYIGYASAAEYSPPFNNPNATTASMILMQSDFIGVNWAPPSDYWLYAGTTVQTHKTLVKNLRISAPTVALAQPGEIRGYVSIWTVGPTCGPQNGHEWQESKIKTDEFVVNDGNLPVSLCLSDTKNSVIVPEGGRYAIVVLLTEISPPGNQLSFHFGDYGNGLSAGINIRLDKE
jgi:hypothetical protein